MEANLRIIKSIQAIDKNIKEQKKEQDELSTKQEIFEQSQRDINGKIENIVETQKETEEKCDKIKEELIDKIKNIELIKPKDGKDGKNGINGKDGRDGKDGADGKDGKNGLNGKDGKDGRNGTDGIDGVGIKNAEINDTGELVITLTDGRKINCGVVRGKDGVSFGGISVTNVEIVNGHLICTLSNGRKIDAGVISGGGGGDIGEETDPIFTASPAHNITTNDITNWNNKSDFSGDYNDLINKPVIPSQEVKRYYLQDILNISNLSSQTYQAFMLDVSEANNILIYDYIDRPDTPMFIYEPSIYADGKGFTIIYNTEDGYKLIRGVVNQDESITVTSQTIPAFSGNYEDLTNKPELFSGDYNDLDNKPIIPTVPTNVSAFTNDAGYLTEHQSLSGYATEQWVENKGYLTSHQDISGKYDKTGGEITGNVKIDGNLTLDIEDEDYDSGITFTKALDDNLGTTLTLTGYANANGSNSNYRPVVRNIGTPSANYDVANKKYVDDNVVIPTYHLVVLNNNGSVDTKASTLTYQSVKNNLTDPKEADYLDVLWENGAGTGSYTRFYADCVGISEVNNGDIMFEAQIYYLGVPVSMAFNLASDDSLRTVAINVWERQDNKAQSIIVNSTNTDKYPSTKAVFDEFQRKPVVVWESNTPSEYLKGIQANLSASPAWQLTDLDLTPFKRIKIYTCAGKGSTNASTTPAIILEMSLDSRAVSTAWGNNYVASAVVQKSNDNNRLATLTCAVSNDKTKFVVLWQTSLYGTAATANNDIGADVFMIEGYYD